MTITEAFERDFFVRHDHKYSGALIHEWLKAQPDPRDERIRVLEEALRNLANEADGFLGMASIQTHGVTNTRVMERKIALSRAALAQQTAAPQAKGETK